MRKSRVIRTVYLAKAGTLFIEGKHGLIRIDNLAQSPIKVEFDERTDFDTAGRD